ncbi:hypothetical protein Dimus_017122 [Dionaea muscipula]
MNSNARTSRQPMKPPLHHRLREQKKMEMQGERPAAESDKAATTTSGSPSMRARKLALMEDVDRLKKKLRHEENIHKALQRAFNRPLGALPRLPPYLPRNTQELLAEVAVLEEEVVRLEEQVVNYRQGLYQEAIYICSSKKIKAENPVDSCKLLPSKTSKHERSRWREQDDVDLLATLLDSSPQKPGLQGEYSRDSNYSGVDLAVVLDKSPRSLAQMAQASSEYVSDETESSSWDGEKDNNIKQIRTAPKDGRGKENKTDCIAKKDVQSPRLRKELTSKVKKIPQARINPSIKQEPVISNQERAQEEISSCSLDNKEVGGGGDSEPNKISEDVLKCLCSIFTRLSTGDDEPPQPLSFSPQKCESESEFLQDPYGCCNVVFKDRDIGSYKHLYTIDACSIDLKRKRNVMFLLHKLKLLLGKLASVTLEGLTHQHKLAFWINTCNACMLNAFLEHGIPDSPEMIVGLMGEATIVVGGQLLNAITIEHFILRLPFYLKYASPKAASKNDEVKASSMFGLEWSEPLVTFALSCGSWSSPAVRVYTASQVESELEAAKRDYLQAAVGVSRDNKLIIPKLLDWYLVDFAKDLESLLDWVCLQLPDQPRKAALRCLEGRGQESLTKLVQVIPYDFSFRYLLCP